MVEGKLLKDLLQLLWLWQLNCEHHIPHLLPSCWAMKYPQPVQVKNSSFSLSETSTAISYQLTTWPRNLTRNGWELNELTARPLCRILKYPDKEHPWLIFSAQGNVFLTQPQNLQRSQLVCFLTIFHINPVERVKVLLLLVSTSEHRYPPPLNTFSCFFLGLL